MAAPNTLNRRTALTAVAGIVSAGTGALASLAKADNSVSPEFIECKMLWRRWLDYGKATAHLKFGTPEHDEAEAVFDQMQENYKASEERFLAAPKSTMQDVIEIAAIIRQSFWELRDGSIGDAPHTIITPEFEGALLSAIETVARGGGNA